MIRRILLLGSDLSDRRSFSSSTLKLAFNFHTSTTEHSSKESGSSDPFTAKLQEKTEDELRGLVNDTIRSAAKEQHNQEDDTENELPPAQPDEIGGTRGKEPTRYGDWERNGRCYDF